MKVNPKHVKMPSDQEIKGRKLAHFKTMRDKLNTLWASLATQGPQLAQH